MWETLEAAGKTAIRDYLPVANLFNKKTLSTQNMFFSWSQKKKKKLPNISHSKQWKLLWDYKRNQIAEVSALNSLLKVSSAILLIRFSLQLVLSLFSLKKPKKPTWFEKPNIHSPSTSELQRAGVSVDEVGVLSTPFEYLREGKKTPNMFRLWGFLYSKTTGDWLLADIFWCGQIFFFSWRERKKR